MNPYASPVEAGASAHRADLEIHSVIRTFRMLSIFTIAEALLVCVNLTPGLVTMGAGFTPNLLITAWHGAMIAFSIFYLMAAARMARRDAGSAAWARRLSALMILGFPLFPVGLFCLPIFCVAGLLCYRKVKRYYPEYCEAIEN